MAKSINGSKKILKELDVLMQNLNQKASIKIGIIGSEAYEVHPDTGLTMAHLGAIHEFGAKIPVTDKMRGYLHHIGIHLKSDTTEIVIPARSFLRDTFFSGNAKERLMNVANLSENPEFNKEYFEYKLINDPDFFIQICKAIGAEGLKMVQDSFRAGGYPTPWKPISEVTKRNRQGSSSNPPLNSTGALMDSLSVEVKKV